MGHSLHSIFVFFRLGELLPSSPGTFNSVTSLCWGDVAIDSLSDPTMLQVHLKKSKCDQFGKGSDIILGRTSEIVCPVLAILHYLQQRTDNPGPFFIDSSKHIICKPWFVKQIREVLNSMGLPQDQYAGHSFRIGAATTAALRGVEDSLIQTLGRWHSSAFNTFGLPTNS